MARSGGRYNGGVSFYTHATARIEVFFPEADVCCQNCKLLTAEYLLKRSRCAITSEIIPDPEYMIGGRCPLMLEPSSPVQPDQPGSDYPQDDF